MKMYGFGRELWDDLTEKEKDRVLGPKKVAESSIEPSSSKEQAAPKESAARGAPVTTKETVSRRAPAAPKEAALQVAPAAPKEPGLPVSPTPANKSFFDPEPTAHKRYRMGINTRYVKLGQSTRSPTRRRVDELQTVCDIARDRHQVKAESPPIRISGTQ